MTNVIRNKLYQTVRAILQINDQTALVQITIQNIVQFISN